MKKKIGHTSCCSRLLWDPKSKNVHFDLLLFHLEQGLKEPQKILPVTLKSGLNQVFSFAQVKNHLAIFGEKQQQILSLISANFQKNIYS